jgi:hypothetical protein
MEMMRILCGAFGGELVLKRSVGRLRRKCEDNIKIDLG